MTVVTRARTAALRSLVLAPCCAAVLMGAATCAPRPRTELVIGVATDLVEPAVDDPLVEASLTVWRPPNAAAPVLRRDWKIGPAEPTALPGSSAIFTGDGSAPRVRIELSGTTRNGRQVNRSHVLDLAAGETRFLRMMLLESCLDASVVGTCIEGQSWPTFIEVDRLPTFREDMPRSLACLSLGANGKPTRPIDTSTGAPLDEPSASCGAGQQCLEGTCYGSSKGTTCRDGERNGTETDVDCGGGGDCPTCALGADCQRGSDCRSGVCNALKKCATSPRCANEALDPGESDVDCGGACDTPCDFARNCATASDCRSGYCSSGRCAPRPTCANGARDASETDIDCGGEGCPPCGVGRACAGNADCDSISCEGARCVDPTCNDGRRNGLETDVDCGGEGGSCRACSDEGRCVTHTDCVSLNCGGSKSCVPATCVDGIVNHGESDVDCGTSCGPTGQCVPGKRCQVAMDCKSLVCFGGRCSTPRCGDTVMNGDETGVDCGGSCSPCS